MHNDSSVVKYLDHNYNIFFHHDIGWYGLVTRNSEQSVCQTVALLYAGSSCLCMFWDLWMIFEESKHFPPCIIFVDYGKCTQCHYKWITLANKADSRDFRTVFNLSVAISIAEKIIKNQDKVGTLFCLFLSAAHINMAYFRWLRQMYTMSSHTNYIAW